MFSATLIVLILTGQTPEPARDAAALIEKLGSASYAEREATKSLESLGSKALPALRSALKSQDLEVRGRARAMINKIEGNLLIQESLVRLDFQDASLDEIVKSIRKQTGTEIGLGPAGPDSAKVRITLSDTRPVPFWKAVDRLCEAGNLTCQYQFAGHAGSGRGAFIPAQSLEPAELQSRPVSRECCITLLSKRRILPAERSDRCPATPWRPSGCGRGQE